MSGRRPTDLTVVRAMHVGAWLLLFAACAWNAGAVGPLFLAALSGGLLVIVRDERERLQRVRR